MGKENSLYLANICNIGKKYVSEEGKYPDNYDHFPWASPLARGSAEKEKAKWEKETTFFLENFRASKNRRKVSIFPHLQSVFQILRFHLHNYNQMHIEYP